MEESKRLEVLEQYEILDTPRDEAFDAIADFARTLLQVPIAFISLVDGKRVWFKSVYGYDVKELPINETICGASYQANGIYIVENVGEDPRTSHHSFAKGPNRIGFYASVPLIVDGGFSLGNLCIADTRPRKLSVADQSVLERLGNLVINQLNTHLAVRKAIRSESNTSNSLQAILDNTQDNIALINPDCSVLYLNKTIRKTLNCFIDKEISIGDNFRDYLVDELRKPFDKGFKEALKGKNVMLEELTTIDGKGMWYSYKMKPVYGKSNELVGVNLTARNIDEAKRAEIALKENAITLQAVLDNTTDSIVFMNADYKVLSINKVAQERLLSVHEKQLQVGDDYLKIIDPNNASLFRSGFQKALNGISSEREQFTKSRFGSGWFNYRMAPVFDESNQFMGVVLRSTDIDQRKKAEIALQQSEEKFRKIVESAANPILILDKDMKMILVNQESERAFGYTSNELINQSIDVLIPGRFRATNMNFLQRYLKDPKPIRMALNKPTPVVKKTGEEILVETSLNTFELNNEVFVLVILQDITVRVYSEKRIKNQVKRLKAIAWQQSHEVRQPVASILGLLHLLKSETNEEDQELFLKMLEKSTNELDRVIHKIVEYTNESKVSVMLSE